MDNETIYCLTCKTSRVHQGIGKGAAYCRHCKRLFLDEPWDEELVYFISW